VGFSWLFDGHLRDIRTKIMMIAQTSRVFDVATKRLA
jgi:hypothetical protein